MFIGKSRSKTSVRPRSFLTPEAIDNLSEYFKMFEKQNNGTIPKLLWNGASNDSLNDWLKALMRKANIDNYGKDVRFHAIRKFVYDTLSKMDETIACVITAKKTDASKITYRTSLDSECARIFKESYKLFALNGEVQGKSKAEQAKKIEELENSLRQVESENLAFKTRVSRLQKDVEDIKLQNFNSNYSFSALVSALEEKLCIKIDVKKLIATQEAKYSQDPAEDPIEEPLEEKES